MFHPHLIPAPGFLREDGVTLRGILSYFSGSVWPDEGVKEEDQCNIALIMI